MESFSYNDIFESKGIEYLAIIAFFLILIPFWIILNRRNYLVNKIKQGLGFLSAGKLNIPQGIYHSRNHTWAWLERSGSARVGLDELLLHMTGGLRMQQHLEPGIIISKGDLLAEFDQNGRHIRIQSPISGIILERNSVLDENPELISEDPYGSGWIYKIKPDNWKEDIKTCYLAEEAKTFASNEIARFKDFLAHSVRNYTSEPSALILQDGGEISENAMASMPPEAWDDFQKEFLTL